MNATTAEKREIARLARKLGKRLGNHLGVEFKPGDSIDSLLALLGADPAQGVLGRKRKPYQMTKGGDTVVVLGLEGVKDQAGVTVTLQRVSTIIASGGDVNGWRVTRAGE